MPLTREEEIRYSRHLILPGVGLEGQERLRKSRVLIVGAGGLGSPVALYLTAAGVGTLGMIDADAVDLTNLQRQVLHSTSRIGWPKVDSASETLAALNPHVRVIPLNLRLTAEHALDMLADYDVVVDCTDNFPTRYLLNDACGLLKKPLVFGSIYHFAGQATVFDVRQGPCYRCLYPEPPAPGTVPTCAEGGVLGVLPGLIGAIQATETLKLLLNAGDALIGRLLLIDAMTMRFHEVGYEKNPECPLCGASPEITALVDYQQLCGVKEDSVHRDEWEIRPDAFAARLEAADIRLVDVREEWEHELHEGLPGALHLPFSSFTRRMHELDTAEDIVLYCSAGIRSWQAVQLLRQAGFLRAWSLQGGLDACEKNE